MGSSGGDLPFRSDLGLDDLLPGSVLGFDVLLFGRGQEVEEEPGGEFVLAEQRPRLQSRVEVVPLRQGDAVAFAVHNRPVHGSKGNYRVNLRHGVSRVDSSAAHIIAYTLDSIVRSGTRHTVGVIFHDAT